MRAKERTNDPIDSLNSINNNVSFYDDEKRKHSSRIAFYHEIYNLAFHRMWRRKKASNWPRKLKNCTCIFFIRSHTCLLHFGIAKAEADGWCTTIIQFRQLLSENTWKIKHRKAHTIAELLITLLYAIIIVWMVLSSNAWQTTKAHNHYHQKIMFGKSFKF